jgi:hypothetical protein
VVKTGAHQKVTDAISALALHGVRPDGRPTRLRRAPHRRKQTLRQAQLRDHLAKIARIAKADLPSVPELQPLRMPKGKPRRSSSTSGGPRASRLRAVLAL